MFLCLGRADEGFSCTPPLLLLLLNQGEGPSRWRGELSVSQQLLWFVLEAASNYTEEGNSPSAAIFALTTVAMTTSSGQTGLRRLIWAEPLLYLRPPQQ